jgi:hypothetical protein
MTLTPDGYRERLADAVVGRYLEQFGVVLIEGPKWCGKTWTGQHHFQLGGPARRTGQGGPMPKPKSQKPLGRTALIGSGPICRQPPRRGMTLNRHRRPSLGRISHSVPSA